MRLIECQCSNPLIQIFLGEWGNWKKQNKTQKHWEKRKNICKSYLARKISHSGLCRVKMLLVPPGLACAPAQHSCIPAELPAVDSCHIGWDVGSEDAVCYYISNIFNAQQHYILSRAIKAGRICTNITCFSPIVFIHLFERMCPLSMLYCGSEKLLQI